MIDGQSIRAATTGDAPAVKTIAVESGLFAPDDMGDFDEMLSGYFDGTLTDHSWIVLENAGGTVVAAAYFAPEPFADRMWNLYFIAVLPGHQAAGTGGALIAHVEDALRRRGEEVARVLIVETSSLERFALTRDFYEKHGYDQEARIREFYGPGDHKVVFWKMLHPAP